MSRKGLSTAVLTVLWSGPQAAFLERYMRPDEPRRPNPSRMRLSEQALLITLVVAVAIVVCLAVAVLFSILWSTVPR